jgi:hypothetical protein
MLLFSIDPVPGQTIEDVCEAEARFVEEVVKRHSNAERKPCLIGNCQAGWQLMIMGAIHPERIGPTTRTTPKSSPKKMRLISLDRIGSRPAADPSLEGQLEPFGNRRRRRYTPNDAWAPRSVRPTIDPLSTSPLPSFIAYRPPVCRCAHNAGVRI